MATREYRPQFRRMALIADDDEFFRIALKSILSTKLGFDEVIEAGSFDDALEKLAETPAISLALFDLQMPGIKSAANLQVVRESFPSIRVAVVSGSQHRHDVMAALNAGVHGYVPKSLGPTELAQALGHILQGTIFIPSSLAELTQDDEETFDARLPSFATPRQAPSLTPRQLQVLKLLIEGQSNKEIARSLTLGQGTVKIHMAALFRNLGVPNRASAAVAGARILSKG
jgi:DNA-binding NarL/FixJ family response regulator